VWALFVLVFIACVAVAIIVNWISRGRRRKSAPGNAHVERRTLPSDGKQVVLATIDYRSLPGTEPEKQIGRYRILELLGSGGMGTVYKAFDPQLDRVVAVKLPHFHGTAPEVTKRIQRFQREARAAAKIWHPHVCPIYDVGEHNGQPYVVMALVEGQSLAQRLSDKGHFDCIAEATTVIRQVLDGLEAVHAHGILHRDLKPANILLDPSSRAVLTDFGLARTEVNPDPITSEGVILGTPAYMAPEQAGNTQPAGPWTDVYSVGVVFYQMLTGRLPFEGSALEILAKVLHESPVPPSQHRTDLPPGLESVLAKALARDPAARLANARQFREALDAWQGTKSDTPHEPTPTADRKPAPSIDTHLLSEGPAPEVKKMRVWTVPRLLGWLGGGLLMATSMSLLALMIREIARGNLAVLLPIPPLALAAFFLGGLLWFLAERKHRGRDESPAQPAQAAPAVPADWVLLACAVLGPLVIVAGELSAYRPAVFSYEQFRDFLERGRIWKVNLTKHESGAYLECEFLNNPDHADVVHLIDAMKLRGNRFIVVDPPPAPQFTKDIAAQRNRQAQGPEFNSTVITGAFDMPLGPSRFVMAEMLAVPVVVALVTGPFLSYVFPSLRTAGLRPWRRQRAAAMIQ